MANTIRALKLMASLGKLDSAVPKPPMSSDSMSPSEASSESEDEKPVYKRVKKVVKTKSDALPVHPSASMPAPKFVAPAKPVVSLPPAPPAPVPAPKVRKPRAPRAKKLTASDPPVAQPPPQAEPAKAPEPKVEPKVEPAEPAAEAKKGRAKKVKKAPSAYNTFVGKMMKEGKSMKEASAAWKAQKN